MNARPTLLWFATLLLLGAFALRVLALNEFPPGIQFDATWYLADALRILHGLAFPAYFDTRPEPAYRFVLAAWFALTGAHLETARIFQALGGTLAIALTYRLARHIVGRHKAWAALIALATLAATMPHLVLSRSPFRALWLSPLVPLAALLLLRLSRKQTAASGFWAGLITTSAIHTYLAGLFALPWLIGFLIHQRLLRHRPRLPWRAALATLIGAALPIIPWALLVVTVPDLFFRVGEAQAEQSLFQQLWDGLQQLIATLVYTGYPIPLYSTPDDALLNPLLLLAFISGLGAALWRWRHADGALVLGGLFCFALPSLLSEHGGHPVRLIGFLPLMAVCAAWGGSLLLRRWSMPYVRWLIVSVTLGSMAWSGGRFFAYFSTAQTTPDPASWLGVPHNYALAYDEALEYLAQVKQATYVPLSALNTSMAAFRLQAQAYPHVTTWARYGLTELPAGQVVYPAYGYYHSPSPASDPLAVLLLPDEQTMVILPPLPDGAPFLTKPSTPILSATHDWVIAYAEQRPAATLPSVELAQVQPSIGGVALAQAPQQRLLAGTSLSSILLWRVTDAPQPADYFGVLQLLDEQLNAVASEQHRILEFLYPSAAWQIGDIVPDLYTLRLPSAYSAPRYRLAAGVYVPPSPQRLAWGGSDALQAIADLWQFGVLWPQAPASFSIPAEAEPLDAAWQNGQVRLLAYQVEQQGADWNITLYWQANAPIEEDWTLFIHALRQTQLVGQHDALPNNGADPTWSWPLGQIVVTRHTLSVVSAPDSIAIGFYRPLAPQTRLALSQDGQAGDTALIAIPSFRLQD